MSSILEFSLNALNRFNNQLPSFFSIGPLPMVSSSLTSSLEISPDYFASWFNLNDHISYIPKIAAGGMPFVSSITVSNGDYSETFVQNQEMAKQVEEVRNQIGYFDTKLNAVVLNGPVTVMPNISGIKKLSIGAVITLASAFLVGGISYLVFKNVVPLFSRQQQETQGERHQEIINQEREKTIRVISCLLGLFSAIAVGRAAYRTLALSTGIYGSLGFCNLYPTSH